MAAAPPPRPAGRSAAGSGAATGGLFDLTSLGSMIEEESRPALRPPTSAVPARPPAAAAVAAVHRRPGRQRRELARRGRAGNRDAAGSEAAAASLFDDEDDFFDLAGELVEELSKEEVFQRDGCSIQQEQSLEEIVEGFKKGVAEHLSPTDYDTHFNLGIAYREMGLLDEAIGEFQLAAKDARYLVVCCSMLGLCFLDKGLPELAIKWYRRGLEAPGLTEEDSSACSTTWATPTWPWATTTAAYSTFVELYGINTNYRDVVAKLAELGRRSYADAHPSSRIAPLRAIRSSLISAKCCLSSSMNSGRRS